MTEEAGLALRLIYSLKQNLGQLDKDVQKHQHTGKLGKELGASQTVSRTLLDAQQHNTSKAAYTNQGHRFFEESMRSKQENPNDLMQSLHLRKFMEAQYKLERRAASATEQEKMLSESQKSAFRSTLKSNLETQRSEKSKKLDADKAVHAALMKHKVGVEKEELRVELALSEKSRRRKLEELEHASLNVSDGIDTFEINLKRLVKADAGDSGAPAYHSTQEEDTHSTPLDHINKLRGMSIPTSKLLEGTQAYVAGVKTQRAEDVASKREREARRRRVLGEQAQIAEETARKTAEESLVTTLARQSAEEQRLAERLWQIKQEKEVMKEDRILREQQYKERRDKDWEATLMREQALHRSMTDDYKQKAALELKAFRAAEAERARAKTAKNSIACKEVAWQLVMLAERCIEHRSITGAAKVPIGEYRRWLALFAKGDPSLGDPVIEPDPEAEEARARALQREKILAQAAIDDYITCSGDFSRSEDQGGPIGPNAVLGEAVSFLEITCNPQVPPSHLPSIPFPIRLAVVGAPFSGKTSVSQELARRFKLQVLDIEVLVDAAVKAAIDYSPNDLPPPANSDGTSDAAASPEEVTPELVKLGLQAKRLLEAGADLPDDLLVAILVQGMEASKSYLPPPEVVLDAKGKPIPPKASTAPKGGKGEAASDGAVANPQGFVVDGFPRTVAQSELLERALTGLDLDKEEERRAAQSHIAPPPPGSLLQHSRPLLSGLDAVLVLCLTEREVGRDESAALKRALGRRMDPTNGRIYHLDDDPPPSNDPGLVARLVEVKDTANDAAQIQRRLSAFNDTVRPLDDWLKRFSRLRRPIDGFGPRKDVIESAVDVAQGVLRSKQAVASAAAAVEAAEKAKLAAERALEYAELARGHAEGAARELLIAKKAELSAAAMLNDPKAKNPDPGATEVLKAQSAARCAESLKTCKAAANDAAGFAERAKEAAHQAGEAKERAESSLGDAEVNAGAEVEARAKASEAEAARAGAESAASKAEASRAAAEIAAQEAERIFTSEQVAPDAALRLAPTAAAVAAEAVAAAEGAALSAPAPLVAVPLTLAEVLLEEWRALEATYLDGLALAFANLSEQNKASALHYQGIRSTFKQILERPDNRAALVTQFQIKFNLIDVDAMKIKETQAELVLRSEELRDTLWGLCDKKAEEAEAERAKLSTDSFVLDQSTLVSQYFLGLVQVELDRFVSSVNFIKGYASSRYGVLPSTSEADDSSTLLSSPDLFSGTVPPDLKDKIDEKSKSAMQFPAWVAALGTRSPGLMLALKVSLATLGNIQASIQPGADEAVAAGKKGGKPAKDAKGKGKEAEGEAPLDPKIKTAIEEAVANAGGKEAEVSPNNKPSIIYSADTLFIFYQMLSRRLQLLAEKCLSFFTTAAETSKHVTDQMGQWIKARYQAECSSVYALDKLVKEAALQGVPLADDLRLEDDGLVVDHGSILVPPPPSLPAPPPPSILPPPQGARLSAAQLLSLARAFMALDPASPARGAATPGWIKIHDAAQLICSLSAGNASFTSASLPKAWQGISNSAVMAALSAFDPMRTNYVDWKEVICSLAAASFPVLMRATCADMCDQVDVSTLPLYI